MAFRLRPVETSFYDLFTKSANQLVQGAALLSEMMIDGGGNPRRTMQLVINGETAGGGAEVQWQFRRSS